MAPRAYWKGYLKLSLVSCPIALYPATSGASASRSGRSTRRPATGCASSWSTRSRASRSTADDKRPRLRGRQGRLHPGRGRGARSASRSRARTPSRSTASCRRRRSTSAIYDSPYYIAPNDNVGQEAFAVIRDAMKGKGMVALGRVVLNKRERVIALEPHGKGILGTTLRYPYEVRKAEEYFEDIPDMKIPGEMLKLAEHILDTKAADFDPSTFEDHYETALVELLQEEAGRLPAAQGQGGGRGAQCHQPDGRAAPQRPERAHPAAREAILGIGREARGRGRKAEEGPQAGRRPDRAAAADPGQGPSARGCGRQASPGRQAHGRQEGRRTAQGRLNPGGTLRRVPIPLFNLERFLRGKRHTCDGRHIARTFPRVMLGSWQSRRSE